MHVGPTVPNAPRRPTAVCGLLSRSWLWLFGAGPGDEVQHPEHLV